MHVLGLHGMPRRVYTYPIRDGLGHAQPDGERGRLADGLRRRALHRRRLDARCASGELAAGQPVGRRHARMGDELSAARQQFPPAADGRGTRAVVGQPAGSAGRRRPARRRARRARHACARRRARPSRRVSGAIGLAVCSPPWRRRRYSSGRFSRRGASSTARCRCSSCMVGWFWPNSADEGGTQPWPIRHRTLPRPNEAPAPGGAI